MGTFLSTVDNEEEVCMEAENLNRKWIKNPEQPPDSENSIRLLTYNILAEAYALKPRHNYCPKKYRKWKYRRNQLKKQLKDIDADIICFQEPSKTMFSHLRNDIQQYEGIFYDQQISKTRVNKAMLAQRAAQAVFVKKSRFEVVQHEGPSFAPEIDTLEGGVDPQFVREFKKFDEYCIIVHLRDLQTGKDVVAVCTHIHWNPIYPHVKAIQGYFLLQIVQRQLKVWGLPESTHILMGMDANSMAWKSEPDKYDPEILPGGQSSGFYELFENGKLLKEQSDHPVKRGVKEFPELHRNFSVYSAYKRVLGAEPLFTNRHPGFTSCIDYVFLTQNVATTQVLGMPYSEETAQKFEYLPSRRHPSDHLPLAVDVVLT